MHESYLLFQVYHFVPPITEHSSRTRTWWQNNQIYTHFSYELLFTEFCCVMFSNHNENMSLQPARTSVPFLSLSIFATAAFITVSCCFNMSRSSSNFLWCSFKSSIVSLPSSKQVNPRFWMLHTDKSLWISTICSTHKIYHICIRIIWISKSEASVVVTLTHDGGRDFLQLSRLALVPTQLPVQGVMSLLSWGKAAGACHWTPTPI